MIKKKREKYEFPFRLGVGERNTIFPPPDEALNSIVI